jgi:hypothetical protein
MSNVRLLSHECNITVNKGYLYYIDGYIIFDRFHVLMSALRNVNIFYVLSE